MNFNRYFYLAVLFGTIGLIASDTFIPSMIAIASHFGVKVSVIQRAITVFMLGFCMARFCVSVLSDGFGRRSMFIFCFILLAAGSYACLMAPTPKWFLLGRFLQGIGAGGSNVLARVIIRDITENRNLAKYNAKYSMYAVTLMVSAPFIGSIFQTYFRWQATFIFIAALSVGALLVSIFGYRETNAYKKLEHLKLNSLKNNFLRLLKAPHGLKYAGLLFVSFGLMTAWLTAGSVILQKTMHLSSMQFGCCALFVGVFYFVTSYLSSQYVKRVGEIKLIAYGVKLLMISPVILGFFFMLSNVEWLAVGIVLAVAVSFAGTGFIIPNAYSLGVKEFSAIAGMAGAFFGFAQMFGGFFYSFIISCFSSYSVFPLGATLLGTAILAYSLFLRLANKAINIL